MGITIARRPLAQREFVADPALMPAGRPTRASVLELYSRRGADAVRRANDYAVATWGRPLGRCGIDRIIIAFHTIGA